MGDMEETHARQDDKITHEINQLFAGWEQGLYSPGEFLNLFVELALKVDCKAL